MFVRFDACIVCILKTTLVDIKIAIMNLQLF